MIGAILGDMIGSPYEFKRGPKSKEFPLFIEASRFTDDSVMTIAVAEALMDNNKKDEEDTKLALISSMQKWGHRYPMPDMEVCFGNGLDIRILNPMEVSEMDLQ